MKEKMQKGIYILPSLFTCGNMTFGLLSIIVSIKSLNSVVIDEPFTLAAWLLVAALFCDILDGRIARLMKATSELGAQLDSLSDLVSFGIAPAILMYTLVLHTMGKIGVAITVLFVLCSALRLARFNVAAQDGVVHKHFTGLPTPASAGIIISFVLSYKLIGPEHFSLTFKTIPVLMKTMPFFFKAMPVVMVILSFLMVSNVPYLSFKKVNLSKPRAVRLLVSLIVLVILIVIYPQNIFFIIFSLYGFSGLCMYASRFFTRKHRDKPDLEKAPPQ
jgi:CDP-diacylglycerol--serine O-phosphatidyltransferase